jgi:hypothetical protein
VRRLAVFLVCLVAVLGARATPAAAFNPLGAICGVASLTSGLLGKACNAVSNGGRLLSAGKKLMSGRVGSAIKTLLGQAAGAVGPRTKTVLSLAAISAWVLGGARLALHEAARVISDSTTPNLDSSWFSATYWRVAGIAALLTLPFLFAATAQALVHSDLALLLRAALGYLPLAALTVGVAAPVTMLLLSASDELSGLVSSAAGHPGSGALALLGLAGGFSAMSGSTFLIFSLGLLTVVGAVTLWMELLMREVALYVVVLMLPLAFAALVWPARRVWAIRAAELLIALVLSKFAMVAVLSLGGAAMDQIGHSPTALIVGLVLVMLGAFAPWALLRLVPLAEMGAAAVQSLQGHGGILTARTSQSVNAGVAGEDWASATTAEMRRAAERAEPPVAPGPTQPAPARRPEEDEGNLDAAQGAQEIEELTAAGGGPEAAVPAASAVVSTPGPEAVVPAASAVVSTPGPEAVDPAAAAGGTPEPDRRQRLPGLGDMWQADDLSWHPLVLGTEEGWPPRVWPGEESAPGEASGVEGLPEHGLDGLPGAERTVGEAGLAEPVAAPDVAAPEVAAPEPPPPADPPVDPA